MKDSDFDRLDLAERQLVMIHSFFPRIDAKVSALTAIVSAQIAVAALNMTAPDLKTASIAVPAIMFLLFASGIIWNLYCCTYPHLEGGQRSLSYFGEISKRSPDDYVQEYVTAPSDVLLRDVAGQIWRNSQIVSEKYRYLKNAMILSFISVIPWTIVLLLTSVANSKLPVIVPN